MDNLNHCMVSLVPSLPVASEPRLSTKQGSSTKKGNSKQNAWKNKDGDKPKRPLSAYNIFFRAERANILKATPSKYEGDKPRRSHGKIGFASLARNVAAKWNNIDPETRKHFDQLAAEDKARYKREMETWKASKTLKQSTRDLSLSSCISSPTSAPPALNAQSIVKSNLIAASQASQDSGRMVFSKFRGANNRGATNMMVTPPTVNSAGFYFHPTNRSSTASNGNCDVSVMGNASVVVGQALALLEDDPLSAVFEFQPLDDCSLETVDSSNSSLGSNSSSDSGRRGSGSSPHISELAAKLDDDCLGFMSGLLY